MSSTGLWRALAPRLGGIALFWVGHRAVGHLCASQALQASPRATLGLCAALILGTLAFGLRPRACEDVISRTPWVGALGLVLLTSALTAITLGRSHWPEQAQEVPRVLAALAGGLWAGGLAMAPERALGGTLALGGMLLACPVMLRHAGALSPVRHALAPPTCAETVQPWVCAARSQLLAQAQGEDAPGLKLCAAAAMHGAEVATLRALCPRPLPATVPHSPGGRGNSVALGHALCAAVTAPLPERGAQALGCGEPCPRQSPPSADDPAGQGHRCRVAAELYAEAGLMAAAQAALERLGHPGTGLAHALGQVERGLEGRPWATQAPTPLEVWPSAATIGPKQLGFRVHDVPGTLTWHPSGPGARGALWGSSRYRGALRTEVPVPERGARPTRAELTLRGHSDLAITLVGDAGQKTFACPAPAPAAHGHGINRSDTLPALACAGAWATFTLDANVGGPIHSAFIHGPFMLARWRWHTAPAQASP